MKIKTSKEAKKQITMLKPLYEQLTIRESAILYHKQRASLLTETKHYLKILIANKLLYQNPVIEDERKLDPEKWKDVPIQIVTKEK